MVAAVTVALTELAPQHVRPAAAAAAPVLLPAQPVANLFHDLLAAAGVPVFSAPAQHAAPRVEARQVVLDQAAEPAQAPVMSAAQLLSRLAARL